METAFADYLDDFTRRDWGSISIRKP